MRRFFLFLLFAFVSSVVAMPSGEAILLSEAPPRQQRRPVVSAQVGPSCSRVVAAPCTDADSHADLSMRLGFGCAAVMLLFTGGTLLVSLHRSLARHGKKEFYLTASVFVGLFSCCSALALSGDAIPAWCVSLIEICLLS